MPSDRRQTRAAAMVAARELCRELGKGWRPHVNTDQLPHSEGSWYYGARNGCVSLHVSHRYPRPGVRYWVMISATPEKCGSGTMLFHDDTDKHDATNPLTAVRKAIQAARPRITAELDRLGYYEENFVRIEEAVPKLRKRGHGTKQKRKASGSKRGRA